MFIYGYRDAKVAEETATFPCSNCNSSKGLLVTVTQRYLHFFWIPIFPLWKTGYSTCSNCQNVQVAKQFPSDLKEHFVALKRNGKAPIWTFSGLILIVLLIAYTAGNESTKESRLTNTILNAQPGDVFKIKNSPSEYTLWLVSQVKSDSVYLIHSEYVVDQETGLEMIESKGNEAFKEGDQEAISKMRLIDLLKSEKIIEIDRKSN